MGNNLEKEYGAGSSKATIGYTPDDYKKALGKTPYSTDTGDTTTDYYNALKNESYKTLLNSEVQASIARDQALKYTNNSLRANGYGNQGLAESTNLGLQSQYQTALANASNTYQTAIRDIDTQHRAEQTTQQRDNFESMTTLMSNASSTDQLNDIIKTYGYGELDYKGDMDWSNLDNSNLDENSKNQIKILYNMYNSQINEANAFQPTLYDSLESLNAGTYEGNDTKIHTFGAHYEEEMKYLWHKGANGEFSEGEAFVVKNGNGDTVYMEWTGKGFHVINESKYNSAYKKHQLTWNDSNKSISYK